MQSAEPRAWHAAGAQQTLLLPFSLHGAGALTWKSRCAGPLPPPGSPSSGLMLHPPLFLTWKAHADRTLI